MSRDGIRRVAIGIAVAALAAALVAWLSSLPLQGWIVGLATDFERYGFVGTALFFLVFGGLAMVLVPTSILSFVAGLVFGWAGAGLAWATMMGIATLSFYLARTIAAGRVARAMERRPRLRIVAAFIDEQGWRVVLLVRVSGMVPFGVQNYLFGATRVRFAHFIAATAVGMLPSIVISAGAGIAGHQALSGSFDALRFTMVGASILVSMILVAVTARELRARFAAAGPGG